MAAATANALRSRITSIFNEALAPTAAATAAAAQRAAAADSFVTVTCTMNNIHVCVSNIEGAVVTKLSGGNLGYKHRARATPVAAVELGTAAAKKAVEAGHSLAHLRFKGPSAGRTGVMRGLIAGGIQVLDIADVTRMPTNGCRPKHMRRI